MNRDEPRKVPDVEALTRMYLDSQERAIAAERILESVRMRQARATDAALQPPARSAQRAILRWGIGVAAAASLLVFLTLDFRQSTAQAEAVKLVREAQDALKASVDRLYRIHIELAPGAAERAPVLAMLAPLDSPLWTRADRFWIEASQPDRSWSFGRDGLQRVWIAPNPSAGLLFEPGEVPDRLAQALDFCTMELEALLDSMLTDFDVRIAGSTERSSAGTTRIRASLKPDRPQPDLRAVLVDIDARTKVVKRVAVARSIRGHPVAEVSFTLEQAGAQADNAYDLAGHVDTGAAIFGPDQRVRRRRQLIRFFGSLFLDAE
jgi:hypothetical protein